MTFRKLFFWAHLLVGVAAGLVILTMAVTGILYAYQRQIIAAAERSIAGLVPPAVATQPLGIEELARKVSSALPEDRPSAFTVRRDPADPVVVNLGRDRVVLAHPVTGEVLGEGSQWRGFLHQVEHVHRDLALGPNGKAITGAASIAFFFLVLSGLVLWWPRKWNRANVAAVTIPSLRLRGKARHFNWHNSIGFWAALPLLLSTLTGMIFSYRWANDLLFRLTGNEPPPARVAGQPRRGEGRPAAPFQAEGLDRMWAAGVERMPAWQTITLRLGDGPGAPVTMMLDEGEGGRPDQRAQLTFDRRSGEVQKWEPYASQNLGRQLRMWVKPIHTGEAFGIIGQTISALVALAALLLVWTGFGLAVRRFRQRRRGPSASSAGSALAPIAETVEAQLVHENQTNP